MKKLKKLISFTLNDDYDLCVLDPGEEATTVVVTGYTVENALENALAELKTCYEDEIEDDDKRIDAECKAEDQTQELLDVLRAKQQSCDALKQEVDRISRINKDLIINLAAAERRLTNQEDNLKNFQKMLHARNDQIDSFNSL